MGIVRAIGVGKTKGSVGDFTYRVVRGRCISSQKVAKRPLTRGESQTLQQFVFGLVTRYMAMHAEDIAVSFNKTAYGSERSYFAKINFAPLRAALRTLYNVATPNTYDVTDAQIEAAVAAYAQANPNSIFRVKRSGYPIVYLDGEWSSEQNPEVIDPALRVSFSALQNQSGGAYSGGLTAYVVGNNLDRVTSVTARGGESASADDSIEVSSFQLQEDGRLKVVLNFEFASPLDGEFSRLVLNARPQGSITWVAGNDEVDPLG